MRTAVSVDLFYPKIGVAAFTVFGLYLGKKAASGMLVSRYAEAISGIILVGIGVNILREHGALFVL